MIDFKDFLVTNPGMEKDAQIAYKRMKTRKSQDYGNDTASTKHKGDTVKEKMTAAQKKKRLDMIRKAVERINKANLEKAKKDALAAMKDMDFFESTILEGISPQERREIKAAIEAGKTVWGTSRYVEGKFKILKFSWLVIGVNRIPRAQIDDGSERGRYLNTTAIDSFEIVN